MCFELPTPIPYLSYTKHNGDDQPKDLVALAVKLTVNFFACLPGCEFCILKYYLTERGTAVAQWLRCCATNRKVAGSIPDGVIGFFIDIILPIALRPWGRLSL